MPGMARPPKVVTISRWGNTGSDDHRLGPRGQGNRRNQRPLWAAMIPDAWTGSKLRRAWRTCCASSASRTAPPEMRLSSAKSSLRTMTLTATGRRQSTPDRGRSDRGTIDSGAHAQPWAFTQPFSRRATWARAVDSVNAYLVSPASRTTSARRHPTLNPSGALSDDEWGGDETSADIGAGCWAPLPTTSRARTMSMGRSG